MILGTVEKLVGFFGSLLGRVTTNKDKIIEGQQRANEAEISGAPVSRLRLWRSFLGWVLSLIFVWEAIMRGIIATYWPDVALPPSVLDEIGPILMGMLGLGL